MNSKILNLKSQIPKIFLLFFVWRIVGFLIMYLAPRFIPYLGFFPYRKQLVPLHKPIFLTPLANFDGINYLVIATQQYHQYIQAFFPLYPTLIRLLLPIFKDGLVAGLIVSNVSFLVGLYVFYKYLKLTMVNFSRLQSKLIILFILAFPTSFFFGAVYTEGLFFLLLISTLYFLKKERYPLVALFSFLTSLTRLVGIFLIIPIIFHFFSKRKKSSIYHLASIIFPLFGLGLYCFYLFKITGDPFFFLTSQPIFGANRSSHLILLPQVYWRYFKIFITAAHDFRFYISIVEVAIFSFVLLILTLDLIESLQRREKIKNFDRLALNLFSFANLILPTLTGTFSSIPRYSLFSISFFIYLAQVKNNYFKYI